MYKYKIAEVFQSIQGEGIHMGKTANFIRFAQCNLWCDWCDTDFSVKEELTIKEILQRVSSKNAMTVITGGEPFMEEHLGKLVEELQILKETNLKHIIAVETNGTFSTSGLTHSFDWVAVSPKPGRDWEIHEECIPYELKYVVDDELTLEKITKSKAPIGHTWLQINSKDATKSLQKALKMIVQDNGLRLGIQMHKVYKML